MTELTISTLVFIYLFQNLILILQLRALQLTQSAMEKFRLKWRGIFNVYKTPKWKATQHITAANEPSAAIPYKHNTWLGQPLWVIILPQQQQQLMMLMLMIGDNDVDEWRLIQCLLSVQGATVQGSLALAEYSLMRLRASCAVGEGRKGK